VISLSAGINNLSPGGKDSAMKRALTLATTGLFVTGLTLLPLSARADEAGKIVTPAATTAGKATVKTDVQNSTSAKDEKKVTSTPSVTTTKTPAKGAL
jgi:Na+/glutamate symporter